MTLPVVNEVKLFQKLWRSAMNASSVIGGVLEMAGFAALGAELERQGLDLRIKPINISTEYLRGGLPERLYARGEVVRAGRRVANVRIEAWQSDRDRPVASCWMNFQLSPKKV